MEIYGWENHWRMVHFKWGEWSLLSLLPKRPDFCHPLSDWPYIHISCARKYRLHPHSSQHHFLVGGWALPLWKIMEFGPVGMMTWPQFDGKVIIHSEWFQTTLTSFPFATGLPPVEKHTIFSSEILGEVPTSKVSYNVGPPVYDRQVAAFITPISPWFMVQK